VLSEPVAQRQVLDAGHEARGEAFDRAGELERRRAARSAPQTGPLRNAVVHFDPCRPHECPRCPMPVCPVRSAPFVERRPLTLRRATRAEPRSSASGAAAPRSEPGLLVERQRDVRDRVAARRSVGRGR
jgi:hypothetical protein